MDGQPKNIYTLYGYIYIFEIICKIENKKVSKCLCIYVKPYVKNQFIFKKC